MRALILLTVALAPLLASCSTPYTYMSYEVVRKLSELRQGDEIKVDLKSDETVRGTIVQIDEPNLTVATFDQGKRRIHWDEVHVLERVHRTRVTVE